MLNKLKNRYAEFIEAATNRSLHKFYNWRDNNYINHQSAVQSLVRDIYMQHRERAIEGKAYFNYKEVGFRYYVQNIYDVSAPFINKSLHSEMDMQVNIFAYR